MKNQSPQKEPKQVPTKKELEKQLKLFQLILAQEGFVAAKKEFPKLEEFLIKSPLNKEYKKIISTYNQQLELERKVTQYLSLSTPPLKTLIFLEQFQKEFSKSSLIPKVRSYLQQGWKEWQKKLKIQEEKTLSGKISYQDLFQRIENEKKILSKESSLSPFLEVLIQHEKHLKANYQEFLNFQEEFKQKKEAFYNALKEEDLVKAQKKLKVCESFVQKNPDYSSTSQIEEFKNQFTEKKSRSKK